VYSDIAATVGSPKKNVLISANNVAVEVLLTCATDAGRYNEGRREQGMIEEEEGSAGRWNERNTASMNVESY
jgi:hypothetical protein